MPAGHSAVGRLLAIGGLFAMVCGWQGVAAGPASAVTPSACDTVAANLVTNCGFESGDLTGWTSSAGVSAAPAAFGEGGSTGDYIARFAGTGAGTDSTLAQTVTGTVTGAKYRLSFSLDNEGGAEVGAHFQATVSNTSVGVATAFEALDGSDPEHTYVSHSMTFTATSTAPTITLSGHHANGYYDLDDVSVVPLTPCESLAGNLVANCSFEAPLAATDWVARPAEGGNAGRSLSEDGPAAGTDYYSFCSTGADDAIGQTIAGTTQGDLYRATFSLANPISGLDAEDFHARVEGTSSGVVRLLDIASPNEVFGYRTFSGTFRAGADAPVLEFAAANVDACWDLDEVSVVDVSTPSQCDAVAGNLVTNCGFEADPALTADPTGWVLTASTGTSDEATDDSQLLPHSGNHDFSFGATGDGTAAQDDTISQSLAGTTAGATYLLSFWLSNPNPASGDEDGQGPDFSATISNVAGGAVSVLPSLHQKTPFEYMRFTKSFVATAATPTISFAGAKQTGWFDLDDVSVVKTADPTASGQPGGPAPEPPTGPPGPPSPTISVTSNKNPASPGDAPTFTATLSPVPGCGSVSWRVDNSAATAPASGSGGTFTLGPVSGLGVGDHPVTAVYSGCATVGGASATLIEQVSLAESTASPTPTPSPTSSVRNPTIVAHVTSDTPQHLGWYRDPVHITFTCTPGSAPLASPCPSPVTFSQDKPGGSVTAKVAGTDGGVGAVTVGPIRIDLDPPSGLVVHPRAGRCTATDSLSGLASCVVHEHRRGGRVHWTAIATDRAGNAASRSGVI